MSAQTQKRWPAVFGSRCAPATRSAPDHPLPGTARGQVPSPPAAGQDPAAEAGSNRAADEDYRDASEAARETPTPSGS